MTVEERLKELEEKYSLIKDLYESNKQVLKNQREREEQTLSEFNEAFSMFALQMETLMTVMFEKDIITQEEVKETSMKLVDGLKANLEAMEEVAQDEIIKNVTEE